MKKRIGIYIALIGFLLVVTCVIWRPSKRVAIAPSSTATATTGRLQSSHLPANRPLSSPLGRPTPGRPQISGAKAVKKSELALFADWTRLLMTPISFYGRVIDDHGTLVPDAFVSYQVVNQIDPNATSPEYTGKSDQNGIFSISGIHGAILDLNITKDGYYRTPPFDGHRGSYDAFTYAGPVTDTRSAPPTSETPATFVLRKIRNGVSLAHWGRSIPMSKDGTPVAIKLDTGRPSPDANLQVEFWAEDQKRDEHGHYLWHVRVAVVHGGLAPRDDEFNFEAPASGYEPQAEIGPTGEHWTSSAERQYFVKTSSGNYARIRVEMITVGDHLLHVETYYNSTVGDRNLESAR